MSNKLKTKVYVCCPTCKHVRANTKNEHCKLCVKKPRKWLGFENNPNSMMYKAPLRIPWDMNECAAHKGIKTSGM